MNDRSPLDNDTRSPRHWSSREVDQSLKRSFDAADVLFKHDSSASHKLNVDDIKRLFIDYVDTLHGDNHDPKTKSIVNEISQRAAAIVHSGLSKLEDSSSFSTASEDVANA